MLNKIKTEPAVIAGLVQAILAAVVAFGLHLTDAQVAGILGVTAAVLALFVRSQVVPVAKGDGSSAV